MTRLIDADKLMKELEKVESEVLSPADIVWNNAVNLCIKTAKSQPTVDAAPVVHGEWRLDLYTAKYGNPYRCSECKEEYGDTYNYCPNCGAKMDGGKDEDSNM